MPKTPSPIESTAPERGLRFPFYDLDSSIEVARSIHNRGGGSATLDQLAAYLKHSGRSGSFLTKLASARAFGLISNTINGVVRNTPRGVQIVAPTYPDVDDKRARVEAFLAVPLFSALYKTYRDKPLPPNAGLENALQQEYGLNEQAALFARRSLLASARQAGFFEARGGQPTHLIRPTIPDLDRTQSAEPAEGPVPPQRDGPAVSRQDELGPSVHKAVRGAVDMLPDPGAPMTAEQLKGLVEAYRTALTIAYLVGSERGQGEA